MQQSTNAVQMWEEPVIKSHQMGNMNKFGRQVATHKNYIDEIEGIPVTELIQKYGSPLFVTSEAQIRNNVRQLKQAFCSRYHDVIHGWSYKTNYTSAVCNIMHQEGSWAEVVSAFEYQKARYLGVPGNRIIFNGPNKGADILRTAISEQAKIHVDHHDELSLIESLAAEMNCVANVTLRLNFDTGYSEAWSRFGFNLESGQAIQAAYYIHNSPQLQLTGLHSHIGTFILDPRAYSAQVAIMCDFMQRVENETSADIEYLDIGGGFASRNALQGVYLPPEQVIPTIEQYASAICDTLMAATAQRELQGKSRPTLILESGRAMIDDAQCLLTSVRGRKYLPDGRKALIVDAGVNVLFTSFWYHHPVKMTRAVQGMAEETLLYGPMCMNIDVVRHSIQLPPLECGDVLHISPVGAYNNTQWMQFIEYRPAVVLVHGEEGQKQVSVIREAEDLDVMNAQDRMPSHLTDPQL